MARSCPKKLVDRFKRVPSALHVLIKEQKHSKLKQVLETQTEYEADTISVSITESAQEAHQEEELASSREILKVV